MKNKRPQLYLARKFDRILLDWKSREDRLPLVVKGARQVGKTESIRHFAEGRYESFVEINFVERPDFKLIIRDGFSVESVLSNISSIDTGCRFIPGSTLIFFDEIQDFPEIATAFKFFAQDGRYDVIASGSLLGVEYNRIASLSVGYQDHETIRSLDFEEFLTASGYTNEQLDGIYGHLAERRPFGDAVMLSMSRRFIDYCALGGMPDVLESYFVKGTFEDVPRIQRRILVDYHADIRKYSSGTDAERIVSVFDSIPAQLAKINKKFQLSVVAKGARRKDYWGCVRWLEDAGVVTVHRAMNFPELPIKGNCSDESYKLYMADSGLLVAMLDETSQDDIRARRNLGTWKGGFFENAVSEALVKAGADTGYWRKENSTLEMDFFLRSRNSLVPVEVKSENGQSKSLAALIANPHYPDIGWGVKLANANIGFSNNVLTVPQWCAFLLPRLMREGDRADAFRF